MGEPTSVMRKRSADQKMRIHVYYDPDTIPALPARKRNKIKVNTDGLGHQLIYDIQFKQFI